MFVEFVRQEEHYHSIRSQPQENAAEFHSAGQFLRRAALAQGRLEMGGCPDILRARGHIEWTSLQVFAVNHILSSDFANGIYVNHITPMRDGVAKRKFLPFRCPAQFEVLIADGGGASVGRDREDDECKVYVVMRGIGDFDAAVDAVAIDMSHRLPCELQRRMHENHEIFSGALVAGIAHGYGEMELSPAARLAPNQPIRVKLNSRRQSAFL